MINVLIKDGNRTVNWDYYPDKTIGDILQENGFKPIPGSVKVAGHQNFAPLANLQLWKLSDFEQEVSPDGKQMRVVIKLKSIPEKKPAIKKGVADSVR